MEQTSGNLKQTEGQGAGKCMCSAGIQIKQIVYKYIIHSQTEGNRNKVEQKIM